MGLFSCFYVDRWTVSLALRLTQGCVSTRLTFFCHSNTHYSPHSHSGLTTHLILNGSLTITYPREENAEKVTYGVGDRIDVDAGKVHEVWIGPEGCTYVIGE